MHNSKESNLRIPGPVPLTATIRDIAASQMINHRGPVYADMLKQMTADLRSILLTKNDAYFITSSGTGAMEAAIANTLSPGDSVLAISIGGFGKRFADIAKAYKMDITLLEFKQGCAADPDEVGKKLKSMEKVKAVLITHNESSTGVTNPLAELCEIIHRESDALILVDAVSSAGGIPIHTDAWGIDVIATASQKVWGVPPGISMITFSEKAWQAYEISGSPRYYFDVAQYRDYLAKGQPPFTPCISTMFALKYSMNKILEEGIEETLLRHHSIADLVRDGVISMGLEILPDACYASDTVTAVRLPYGTDGKEFLARAEKEHNVIFGGGQENLTGKIFRIGHMGWVEEREIIEALEAAKMVLSDMNS